MTVFSKVTVDGQNAESGLFVSYIYQILLNVINAEAQRMHNRLIAYGCYNISNCCSNGSKLNKHLILKTVETQ